MAWAAEQRSFGCPSATISHGLSALPRAEDCGGACRYLLRRRGIVAFHQARAIFENRASLHSMARSDGAGQRRF